MLSTRIFIMAVDPRLERDIGSAEAPGGVPVLTAYKDSLGYWTIGRGHLLEPQEHDWTGYSITAQQEQMLFDTDIMTAEHFAQRLPEWAACDTACRQNALIELCFNMRGKWLGFTHCRQAWQAKNWPEAKAQLLDSEWADEVHAVRADRIGNYILTGEYPS
jgi:GH24 family phage-related lysozyme (muramidase)